MKKITAALTAMLCLVSVFIPAPAFARTVGFTPALSAYGGGDLLSDLFGILMGDDGGSPVVQQPAQQTPSARPKQRPAGANGSQSWSIYWYLCGSNLESEYKQATIDLMEALAVQLPTNVTFVIQTGGSNRWYLRDVNPNKSQRWVFDSSGIRLVSEKPKANMGASSTLQDFLAFCKYNYPADKTGVLFWNHGGGSVRGAEFDEQFGKDSLTLSEMDAAFNNVYGQNKNNPALEFVAFDTCFMATIDTADTFCPYAKYLYASQEEVPGNGLQYTGWVGALADDPDMDGAELGKVVCDTFMQGCKAVGTQRKSTFSVTDLTKLEPLMDAYEDFGTEALVRTIKDPSFFAQYARVAANSENYGDNTRAYGCTNMVDLGHIARQEAGVMDSARPVVNGLKNAVIYKVAGDYRGQSTGLSCFYSYDNDKRNIDGYMREGAGDALKAFYNYAYNGEIDDGFINSLPGYVNTNNVSHIPTLDNMGWDNAPVSVTDDGYSLLNLGPKAKQVLSDISFTLAFVSPDDDLVVYLGSDNDIDMDWENGRFKDNFTGTWGALGGQMVYMDLAETTADYFLYTSPILLNGQDYTMYVAYDLQLSDWVVIGASQGLDESGMAQKEMRQFKPGDIVEAVMYGSSITDMANLQPIPMEPVTITNNTSFGTAKLPDGEYLMMYQMEDALGNTAYSDAVYFDYNNGSITTSVYN